MYHPRARMTTAEMQNRWKMSIAPDIDGLRHNLAFGRAHAESCLQLTLDVMDGRFERDLSNAQRQVNTN
jgi:hypothetical protein